PAPAPAAARRDHGRVQVRALDRLRPARSRAFSRDPHAPAETLTKLSSIEDLVSGLLEAGGRISRARAACSNYVQAGGDSGSGDRDDLESCSGEVDRDRPFRGGGEAADLRS